MSGEKVFTVGEFTVRPANEKDFAAYAHMPDRLPESKSFCDYFIGQTGYNPGSSEGNRQICKICGKGGPECLGHPTVLDMTGLNRRFLSEFAHDHIRRLSLSICRNCKNFVSQTNDVFVPLKELSKLPLSKKKCSCTSPTIVEIREEKTGEKRQKYQRKNTDPKKFTSGINEFYDLLADPSFTVPPQFNIKKETILGFFYNKIFMLPAAEHQINFVAGMEASVSETTGMMQLYENIYNSVTKFADADAPELRKKLTLMYIGESESNYTGTPSYLTKMDGKEGLFRNEGINKRAFNTARAVITLGTRRSCEIQIAEYIQKNLQYKIKVMTYNIGTLQKKVGLTVTSLVTDMETSTLNCRKTFTKLTPNYKLKIGDVVLKTIEDGDHVIFSRQPTLWRHSELGYIVFGWNNKCIGLPETNTAGHNADFDGDEGNISIGADLDARIENQMILAKYNLTGAHSGEPVIGITYNGAVGAYVISTDDNIPEHLFEKLVSIIEGEILPEYRSSADNYITDIKVDREYYNRMAVKHKLNKNSGRILISMLLPKCLEYKRGDVEIHEGIMVKGKLKKVDVANKLISAIINVNPWRSDYLFVDRGYAMLSEYISAKGITISGEDYIMPGELNKQVKAPNMEELTKELEQEVEKLEMMKLGQTKAYVDNIESRIVRLIGEFEQKASSIMENSEYGERQISIVSFKSGARGNTSNIMTAVVMVGQQYDGIDRLGGDGERLSPYIAPDEVSIYSRGFIKHSYSDGLNPSELCMIANPSRRSTFAVYSGTPESGNASRQAVRNLGGLHVDGSLALIDRTGRVVDPLYGAGCDSARTRNQNVRGFTVNSALDIYHTMQIQKNLLKYYRDRF